MSEEHRKRPWELHAALQGRDLAARETVFLTDLALRLGLQYTWPRAAGLPEERAHLNFGNKTGIPLPVRAGGEEQVPKLEMDKLGFPGLTSSEPAGQMAQA